MTMFPYHSSNKQYLAYLITVLALFTSPECFSQKVKATLFDCQIQVYISEIEKNNNLVFSYILEREIRPGLWKKTKTYTKDSPLLTIPIEETGVGVFRVSTVISAPHGGHSHIVFSSFSSEKSNKTLPQASTSISITTNQLDQKCPSLDDNQNTALNHSSTVRVWPNPASDLLSLSTSEEVSLNIFNMLGQCVYTEEHVTGTKTIDLTSLERQGFIFLVMRNNKSGTHMIKKIILN